MMAFTRISSLSFRYAGLFQHCILIFLTIVFLLLHYALSKFQASLLVSCNQTFLSKRKLTLFFLLDLF